MNVKDIIPKIRYKLGDLDEAKYSDFQIYKSINEGYRYIQKTCRDKAPDIISKFRCLCVEPGTNVMYVSNNPVRITDVRVDGRKIHPALMSQIENIKASGVPNQYVVKSFGNSLKILLFPVPSNEIECAVSFIDEVGEIGEDDELTWPNEIINILIDFTVNDLIGTEAPDKMGLALESLLEQITPAPCVVDSYY